MSIAVAFYEENVNVGRVVSARIEIASIDDFYALDQSGSQIHCTYREKASDDDEVQQSLPFFVVERGVQSSSGLVPTVLRFYSLHDSVVDYLTSQDDGSLVEDGELLRFAVSTSGIDAGMNPFATTFQKLRPLEVENRLLRSALGFSKRDAVDVVTVKKKMAAIKQTKSAASIRNSIPSSSPAIEDVDGDTVALPQYQQHAVPGDDSKLHNSSADPFSIHAPHLWEMETDAAINARTKYHPYRQHSPNGRRLDLVTQQHLVVRLHDKSVDMLRHRRSGRGREVDPTERRCLSPDEQVELGVRLHDKQREHTAKVLGELTTKFHGSTSPKRVLTADELNESTARIYREPMEKKRNNLEKLIQKYVFDEEDKYSKMKLTAEQQKAMADRLSSKK